MLKIRWPLGRLNFNMGIAIPGKTVFLIETAPWIHQDPLICGISCRKQVSQAGISNCILWDAITNPYLRYPLLAPKSTYNLNKTTHSKTIHISYEQCCACIFLIPRAWIYPNTLYPLKMYHNSHAAWWCAVQIMATSHLFMHFGNKCHTK